MRERKDAARGYEYRVTVILRASSRKVAERWFNTMLVPMRNSKGVAVAFVSGASIKVQNSRSRGGRRGR